LDHLTRRTGQQTAHAGPARPNASYPFEQCAVGVSGMITLIAFLEIIIGEPLHVT
jgi:hypothetical protein